jgi:gas vesicle protein
MFLVQLFFDPNSYQKKSGGAMNTNFIIGMIIGIFIGANIGIIAAALLAAAKRGDNEMEEEITQWQLTNSQN